MESEMLDRAIVEGNEVTIRYIKSFHHLHDVEIMVVRVLTHMHATPEMVDAACQAFVDIGTSELWTLSLCHFTSHLWKLRADQWIKKFNGIAFGLAAQGNWKGCGRLVHHFMIHAGWNDDPADFHLVPNMAWMSLNHPYQRWRKNWPEDRYLAWVEKRIRAGKFPTEEAFLEWRKSFGHN